MSVESEHEATFDAHDFRPCHSCGELVRMMALRCRYCGHELQGEAPLADLVAAMSKKLAGADELERTGAFPHNKAAEASSRFRVQSLVSLALLIGSVAAAALVNLAPGVGQDLTSIVTFLSVVVGVLTLITTCAWMWDDLSVPIDEARTTPEAAFCAFFHGMRQQRWKYAYACLLPGNDEDELPRARVAQKDLNIPGGVYRVVDQKSFTDLWRPMVTNSGVYIHNISRVEIETYPIDDRNAIAQCTYTVQSYNRLVPLLFFINIILMAVVYLITRRKGELRLVKYMRKVGDKWYVASAGIQSGEDLLPKLYGGEVERLVRGELPPEEVIRQALSRPAPEPVENQDDEL